jgi:hypothetical protein
MLMRFMIPISFGWLQRGRSYARKAMRSPTSTPKSAVTGRPTIVAKRRDRGGSCWLDRQSAILCARSMTVEGTAMTISFPRDEDRSHMPDPITFFARTATGRVLCKVSHETLHDADRGQGADETARELWNRYVDMVEEAAAEKILNGGFEPDGTIVVRYHDLEAMRRDSA